MAGALARPIYNQQEGVKSMSDRMVHLTAAEVVDLYDFVEASVNALKAAGVDALIEAGSDDDGDDTAVTALSTVVNMIRPYIGQARLMADLPGTPITPAKIVYDLIGGVSEELILATGNGTLTDADDTIKQAIEDADKAMELLKPYAYGSVS